MGKASRQLQRRQPGSAASTASRVPLPIIASVSGRVTRHAGQRLVRGQVLARPPGVGGPGLADGEDHRHVVAAVGRGAGVVAAEHQARVEGAVGRGFAVPGDGHRVGPADHRRRIQHDAQRLAAVHEGDAAAGAGDAVDAQDVDEVQPQGVQAVDQGREADDHDAEHGLGRRIEAQVQVVAEDVAAPVVVRGRGSSARSRAAARSDRRRVHRRRHRHGRRRCGGQRQGQDQASRRGWPQLQQAS